MTKVKEVNVYFDHNVNKYFMYLDNHVDIFRDSIMDDMSPIKNLGILSKESTIS